jgi:hypothetical protein
MRECDGDGVSTPLTADVWKMVRDGVTEGEAHNDSPALPAKEGLQGRSH